MPIYQPIFLDGWAPVITEPELIGFTPTAEQQKANAASRRETLRHEFSQRSGPYSDGDEEDQIDHTAHTSAHHSHHHSSQHHNTQQHKGKFII